MISISISLGPVLALALVALASIGVYFWQHYQRREEPK